jgi:hypothetical protein
LDHTSYKCRRELKFDRGTLQLQHEYLIFSTLVKNVVNLHICIIFTEVAVGLNLKLKNINPPLGVLSLIYIIFLLNLLSSSMTMIVS